MKKFSVDTAFKSDVHEIGNKNCEWCYKVPKSFDWIVEDDTKFPVKCKNCEKGLVHAEHSYIDDGLGGTCEGVLLRCDNCLDNYEI